MSTTDCTRLPDFLLSLHELQRGRLGGGELVQARVEAGARLVEPLAAAAQLRQRVRHVRLQRGERGALLAEPAGQRQLGAVLGF